jgi:hypothetical protein
MSELPANWNEIKADKVFWDMVLAFRQKDSQWSQRSDEELLDDESELHLMAVDFVRSEGDTVFSVYFENYYGQPASSTVQELAGKFYVTDWAEPVTLCGPYATAKEGALSIVDPGDTDVFSGASSSLPADEMHSLCESLVRLGGQFELNGVMHVRTRAGLMPGTEQSFAAHIHEWNGVINAPGLLASLAVYGRECGQIKPGEGLPKTEEVLRAMVAAAIKSGKTEFILGKRSVESGCSEVKVFAGYYWGCTWSGINGPYHGLEEAVEKILSLAEVHFFGSANGSVSDAFLAERCARLVKIYYSFEINGKVYVKTESGLELEGS